MDEQPLSQEQAQAAQQGWQTDIVLEHWRCHGDEEHPVPQLGCEPCKDLQRVRWVVGLTAEFGWDITANIVQFSRDVPNYPFDEFDTTAGLEAWMDEHRGEIDTCIEWVQQKVEEYAEEINMPRGFVPKKMVWVPKAVSGLTPDEHWAEVDPGYYEWVDEDTNERGSTLFIVDSHGNEFSLLDPDEDEVEVFNAPSN